MAKVELAAVAAGAPVAEDEPRDWCFLVTYAIVCAVTFAFLAGGLATGNSKYFYYAGCMVVAGVLGRVAPLYPVGIASVFAVGVAMVEHLAYVPAGA